MSALFLSVALTLSANPAHAGGWDWDDDEFSRHWRTASLNWASDIHPGSPTHSYLIANVTPPPEELWCHDPPSPTQADLDHWDDLLKDWMVDFLDLGPNDPLPPTPPFPFEC